MDVILDPWSWWIEPFLDDSVLREALIASLLVILCSCIIGTWVIIRGMSFFSDALAHGILPGVSIAAMLNGNIFLGAMLAALFMVGGIRVVRRFSPLPNDVSIGLLFVGMLALTLVISSGEGDEEELHEFLFGNVREISGGGLILQGVSAFIIILGSFVLYRAFLTTTFDTTLSRLLKMRPEIAETGLLVLLALSIVASFRVVGSLLLFALLIAPPATAALFCKKVWTTMASAVGHGVIAVFLGLIISHHTETSGSAVVALTAVGIFFVMLAVRTIVVSKNHGSDKEYPVLEGTKQRAK